MKNGLVSGAPAAGWVIPKLAAQEPLAFNIIVSPAINWLSQGKYFTRKQIEKDGFSEAEIQAQEAYNQQVLKLLEKHASYEEYLRIAQKSNLISRERWTFIGKNFSLGCNK